MTGHTSITGKNLSVMRIKIDGTAFSITTFDDEKGTELQRLWKEYIDSVIVPVMNPATLYQMDRYS